MRTGEGLAVLPAGGVLRRRRARVTVAFAALSMAAAAVVAAASVPVPGSPAMRDAAYVAGHGTRALTPVLPGVVFFMRSTITRPGPGVRYIWARGGQTRLDVFMSGRPVFDRGSTATGATVTNVLVDYQHRTWSRLTFNDGGQLSAPSAAPPGRFTCDSANKAFGIVFNPIDLLASLRAWESCGWLRADGTATVDGVAAVRLVIPFRNSSPGTWWVSRATYLPVRATVVNQRGKLLVVYDFRWLPPTRANLAKLALPVPPRGFTRVAAG